MTSFRTMEMSDIPAGLALCRMAGWNQVGRDWELFLTLNREGCLVCVDNQGNVAGTVTTIQYGNHFSWIGMVLVDPAQRKKGIGFQLLTEALETLKGQTTVKLDATPEGRHVYLKLDFQDEYPLSRMTGKISGSRRLPWSAAVPATAKDLAGIALFDEFVFGANRKHVLEWLFNGAPNLAFMVERDDELQGFCFGRHGHNFTHIGPVVAQDFGVAASLLSCVLRNCLNKPVVLDVPEHNEPWLKLLKEFGFAEQRTFTRMYRGTNLWHGSPAKQFAILGPEFG
jgi:ribosomal protein S18 acetylase RimI-like enzyme